jgi:hypothetical protein
VRALKPGEAPAIVCALFTHATVTTLPGAPHRLCAPRTVLTCRERPSRTFAPLDRRTPVCTPHHGRLKPRAAGQAAGAGARTGGGRHHNQGVRHCHHLTNTASVSPRGVAHSHNSANRRTATKSDEQYSFRSIWAPNSLRSCRATCARRVWLAATALARDPPLWPPSPGHTSRRRPSNSRPSRSMPVRRRA